MFLAFFFFWKKYYIKACSPNSKVNCATSFVIYVVFTAFTKYIYK